LMLANLSALAAIPAVYAALQLETKPQRTGAVVGGLPHRQLWPSMVSYFLFGVGYIVYLTFLVAWMRDQGADAGQVALTWGVLGAAVMVSPLVWRGILARSSGGGALGLAFAATAAGTLLPHAVPGAEGLLLSAAVFGISFFMGPAAVTNFSRKNLAEPQWGRAVALYTAVFALGQTVGPVAAGWVADAQSLSSGLLAAGGVLSAAAAAGAMQRPLGRPSMPDGMPHL
jgi:predicted MFS family arabinose efflux permease